MLAASNEEKVEISPNLELSETDKAFMRVNYPYIVGNKQVLWANFEASMKTLNLDAATVASLTKQRENGYVPGVRRDYVKYVEKARAL